MVRAATLATCILLGAGCQRDAFFCDTPEDCTSEDGDGSCESTGYCSFPDPECDTGRRYGDLAPSGLAGTCVPQVSDTEGSGTTGSSTGTSTGTSDPTLAESSSSSTSTSTTVAPGSSSESSTSGTSDESSSTGIQPSCCDASCSTCGDACASEFLDSTDEGEALAVAVVGTTLVWTTGYNRQVFTVDLTTNVSTLLATTSDAITNIATDDEYIYYLSYANALVGRISLATGGQSTIANANDVEDGSDFQAGFGQIVLDEDNVYFALANTPGEGQGGAFRAPKTPEAGLAPERIGTVESPVGIGVDEDRIYISDVNSHTVFSYEKASVAGAPGTDILELQNGGHLYVAETDVWVTSSGEITRISKDGSAQDSFLRLGGSLLGITGDETHVYFTEFEDGGVTRVALSGQEPPVQIATSPGAWGIATDCNHVYWAENGSLSVLRQPK